MELIILECLKLELDRYIGQSIIGRYQGKVDISYRLSTIDKISA